MSSTILGGEDIGQARGLGEARPGFSQPEAVQHREGRVARAIEKQTAKLPSDLFLWLGLGAIAGSVAFQVAGKREVGNFIGEWVPTILILGLYNKLVKVAGSDRTELAR
jgi:hypothetical protein